MKPNAYTCSKSTLKTLEQSLKSVKKLKKKPE